jgi:hypothetical protein
MSDTFYYTPCCRTDQYELEKWGCTECYKVISPDERVRVDGTREELLEKYRTCTTEQGQTYVLTCPNCGSTRLDWHWARCLRCDRGMWAEALIREHVEYIEEERE